MLALLVYLGIAWFILLPQAFCTPDEGAKLLQLQNLRWEDGRLAHDIAYPGRDIDSDLQFAQHDPVRGFLRVRDGALYFQRLPVFPLLVLPFFRWFGFPGLYLLPAIGGAASGVLALQLLKRSDRRFGMWMLIAFGSPVFVYATIFWEHTLATSLGLAGAWLAFHLGPTPRKTLGWIAVGILLGISVYIRLEMMIFALAWLFACWVVFRDGRWGPVWAGISLGLVMLPYRPLHGIMFAGQKIPDHAAWLFYPFAYLALAKWRAVPELLIGPPVEGAIDTGWLGDLWAVAAVIVIGCSLGAKSSPAKRAIRLTGLAITAIVGAAFLFDGTLYPAAHGLLFTTPWALLGLARAREVWQCSSWRGRIVVLATILGLIGYTVGIIVLRAGSPQGGLEWGARFAMIFYPLLALLAAWDLGADRRDVKTLVIVGVLMLLGFGFQTRGLWTLRYGKQINAALDRAIVETPERHIVTDLWWMPLNAAPVYSEKEIFVTDTPEELRSWVELAVAGQVQRFLLVTMDHALLDNTNQVLGAHRLNPVEARVMTSVLIYRVEIEPR